MVVVIKHTGHNYYEQFENNLQSGPKCTLGDLGLLIPKKSRVPAFVSDHAR